MLKNWEFITRRNNCNSWELTCNNDSTTDNCEFKGIEIADRIEANVSSKLTLAESNLAISKEHKLTAEEITATGEICTKSLEASGAKVKVAAELGLTEDVKIIAHKEAEVPLDKMNPAGNIYLELPFPPKFKNKFSTKGSFTLILPNNFDELIEFAADLEFGKGFKLIAQKATVKVAGTAENFIRLIVNKKAELDVHDLAIEHAGVLAKTFKLKATTKLKIGKEILKNFAKHLQKVNGFDKSYEVHIKKLAENFMYDPDGSFLMVEEDADLEIPEELSLILADLLVGGDLITTAKVIDDSAGLIDVGKNLEAPNATDINANMKYTTLTTTQGTHTFTSKRALSQRAVISVGNDLKAEQAKINRIGAQVHAGGRILTRPNGRVDNVEQYDQDDYKIWSIVGRGKRKGLFRGRREIWGWKYYRKGPYLVGMQCNSERIQFYSEISANKEINFKGGGKFNHKGYISTSRFENDATAVQIGEKEGILLSGDELIAAKDKALSDYFEMKKWIIENEDKDSKYIFEQLKTKGYEFELEEGVTPEEFLKGVVLADPAEGILEGRVSYFYSPEIEKRLLQGALFSALHKGYLRADLTLDEHYRLFRKNAIELAKQLEIKKRIQGFEKNEEILVISKEQLPEQYKDMLVYRKEYFKGKEGLAPHLMFGELKLTKGHDLIQGDYVYFSAKEFEGSNFNCHGIVQASKELRINSQNILVEKRIAKNIKIVQENRRSIAHVEESHGIDDTGVLTSNGIVKLQGDTGNVHGGEIYGGEEVDLEFRYSFKAEGLRTQEAHQGRKTKGGKNHAIVPIFETPWIKSGGRLNLKVTEGNVHAKGANFYALGFASILAKYSILFEPCYKEYLLPSTKERRKFGGHKTSGGSATAVQASTLFGKEGIDVRSEEDDIAFLNTRIISSGTATFMGKTVTFKGINKRESRYATKSGIHRFSIGKIISEFESEQVKPTIWSIEGDVTIDAAQTAELRAVQGSVGGNMMVRAPETVIAGSKAQTKHNFKSNLLGISNSYLNVAGSILNNQNFQDTLKVLANNSNLYECAKRVKNENTPITQAIESWVMLIEAYQVATAVASGCLEEGVKGGIGAITDELGLTKTYKDRNGKNIRKVNLDCTFKLGKSWNTKTETSTVATKLEIGGLLDIKSDIIRLIDGTQIEAGKVRLFAKELLQFKGLEDSCESSDKSNDVSVGMDLRESKILNVGVDGSRHTLRQMTHKNANIESKTTIDIEVTSQAGNIFMEGLSMYAKEGMKIKAAKVDIESLKEYINEKRENFKCNIDLYSKNFSMSASNSNYRQTKVNEATKLGSGGNIEFIINEGLLKGVIIETDKQFIAQRFDGEDGPPTWEVINVEDIEETKRTSVSVSTNFSDQLQEDKRNKLVKDRVKTLASKVGNKAINRTTIIAKEGMTNAPEGVNTDISATRQVTKKIRKGIGFVWNNFDHQVAEGMQDTWQQVKEKVTEYVSKHKEDWGVSDDDLNNVEVTDVAGDDDNWEDVEEKETGEGKENVLEQKETESKQTILEEIGLDRNEYRPKGIFGEDKTPSLFYAPYYTSLFRNSTTVIDAKLLCSQVQDGSSNQYYSLLSAKKDALLTQQQRLQSGQMQEQDYIFRSQKNQQKYNRLRKLYDSTAPGYSKEIDSLNEEIARLDSQTGFFGRFSSMTTGLELQEILSRKQGKLQSLELDMTSYVRQDIQEQLDLIADRQHELYRARGGYKKLFEPANFDWKEFGADAGVYLNRQSRHIKTSVKYFTERNSESLAGAGITAIFGGLLVAPLITIGTTGFMSVLSLEPVEGRIRYGVQKGLELGGVLPEHSLDIADVATTGIQFLAPGVGVYAFNKLATGPLNLFNLRSRRTVDVEKAVNLELYRAVKPEELGSIINTRQFIQPVGVAEGKYFTTNLTSAKIYAEMAEKAFGDRPYSFVKTTLPIGKEQILNSVTIEAEIKAIVIPSEHLTKLSKPEVIEIFPSVLSKKNEVLYVKP